MREQVFKQNLFLKEWLLCWDRGFPSRRATSHTTEVPSLPICFGLVTQRIVKKILTLSRTLMGYSIKQTVRFWLPRLTKQVPHILLVGRSLALSAVTTGKSKVIETCLSLMVRSFQVRPHALIPH